MSKLLIFCSLHLQANFSRPDQINQKSPSVWSPRSRETVATTIDVDVTCPKASKVWRKSPSVTLYARLPMKSFILIPLDQPGEVFTGNFTLGGIFVPLMKQAG
jgi:hypothetical protein